VSPQRAHRYELIILNADDAAFKRCNVLNPATLPPVPSDGELHDDCAKVVFLFSCLREDLQGQSLDNSDPTLFTDGSSHYVNGKRHTGYEMVRNFDVLETEPLQSSVNAQEAE